MTNQKSEATTEGRRPIAFHALLVEIFETGEMRVRIDNGVLGMSPSSETRRPADTGASLVSRVVGLGQVYEAAGVFIAMLRDVYPVDGA